MVTCQKCIRTGDIDNVGITSRHGTFFEMLGNFSFGDYFKKESLEWGWEFLTKTLEMPAERLWVTVYRDDEDTFNIWKSLGVPEERIVKLGKEDNFWEIGLGPCGPDSEIFFDRGEEYACDNPDCKPGCECDRFIEVWNHVFSQFSKEEDGTYTPLRHPNIDTGMGLERMACIIQGVDSIFDIDTIRHILNGVSLLSGIEYNVGNKEADISMRIITDHLRSMVFMISDTITPSNEGRGYVLRRLIRRAARHGKMLGIKGEFLASMADKVIEVSGEAYPELKERQDYIKNIIASEEKQFVATLLQGENIIGEYISDLKAENKNLLDGEKVFKLYDTYGFPPELTEEILGENGMSADLAGFEAAMEKQKDTARKGRRNADDASWDAASIDLEINPTEFVGYTVLETESKVLAVVSDGKSLGSAQVNSNVGIYLDKTPFYAQGGGQISDTGVIFNDSVRLSVLSVVKEKGLYRHNVTVEKGSIAVGDTVNAGVDTIKRNKTARNHTSTHLLHAALRKVLGNHVQQAGSLVNEKELRFDFNHFEPVTEDEKLRIEALVNDRINDFIPVTTLQTTIEKAKQMGAMALFGEKYGNDVRVVSCSDFSIELCGGTHVSNTGEIGAFKISSESGVASGVRRIVAVTSSAILEKLVSYEKMISEISENLKAKPNNLLQKTTALSLENKSLKKEIEEIKKESVGADVANMISSGKQFDDGLLIKGEFRNCSIDDLRNISDEIKAKAPNSDKAIVVLAAVSGEKVSLLVSVSDGLLDKGYHAGKIIKQLAKSVGGGGGGKADMAQAGGKDPSGVPEVFKLAEELLT